MIFSNAPHCGTGYGVQCGLLARRLRDAGHDVAIHAYFGVVGGIMDWEGISMFPHSDSPTSQDMMVPLAKQLQADAVIAVTDPWIIETHRFQGSGVAYVPWFPVDGVPMDGENHRGIMGPGPDIRFPIATSEHAAAMARDKGITDLRTIPYAVDTSVFTPGDRAEARERWAMPPDAFMVGVVAMNRAASGIDRKRLFEQIGAFAMFKKRHPDAMLHLHMHPVAPQGVPVMDIIRHHGLRPSDVMFTEGLMLICGIPGSAMAELYRGLDVVLGVSGGEGAGVPLLEANACGTPVIYGDWTAMPEYAKAGWAVTRDEAQPQWNQGRVAWMTPRMDAIAARLEEAYDARGDQALAAVAREGALENDADRLFEDRWVPALDDLEGRIRDAKRVLSVPIPDILKPKAAA